MRMYIYRCEKCHTNIKSTFTMAVNKDVAWNTQGMQDQMKGHDIEYHGFDEDWPHGKIICLVPLRRHNAL